MILRQIKLQSCRCFRKPIELGKFGDGVNLITGPNESGKSTIIELVDRALFYSHTSKAAPLKELVPWGTNLSPEIELEFESGGRRYRLEKGFLDHARAKLAKWEDGDFVSKWEGDAADNFLRERMLSEAPLRGASKPTQWGLAQMLWSAQRGEGASLGASDLVADRLREALGGSAATQARGPLADRIADTYKQHWTPTGKLAARATAKKLLDEQQRLQAEWQEVDGKYREAESYESELGNIEVRLEDVKEEITAQTKRAAKLEEAAEGVQKLRQEIAQLEKEIDSAEKEYERLRRQVEEYEKAETEHAAEQQKLSELQEQLQAAQVSCEAAEELLRQVRTDYDAAEQASKAARQALENCRSTRQAQQLLDEERSLEQSAQQIEACEIEHESLKRDFESRKWPSAEEVQQASELQLQRDLLQVKLEAVGITVMVELLSTQEVSFAGGEEGKTHQGSPGQTLEYHAGQEAVVTLEGVACIRARSGAEEPEKLAQQLGQTKEELEELLASFDVDSVDALVALQRRGKELERQIEDLRKQIESLAGEHETASGVRKRQAQVENQLGLLLSRLELSRHELAARDAGDEESLVRKDKDAAQRAERERERLDEQQEKVEKATKCKSGLQTQRAGAQATVEGRAGWLQTILRSENCSDLKALKQREGDASQALTALQDSLLELRGQLPEEAEDPARQLKTARDAIIELQNEQSRLKNQTTRLQTLLEEAQRGNLYERKTRLADELERLGAELERATHEALAVHLLHTIYEHRRSGAAETLEGLKSKFDQLFRAICGIERPVTITPDFEATELQPAPDQGSQPIKQFSSGTQEQLNLCLRLAMGEVYAEKFGRQMMVLDDVLVYTDPDRHRRVMEIIKLAGEKLQIFIFTSHPDYYRGLTEHRFDIPELVRQS